MSLDIDLFTSTTYDFNKDNIIDDLHKIINAYFSIKDKTKNEEQLSKMILSEIDF
jgi:hypothetical protein